MADTHDQQPRCRDDSMANDFEPLFAQLTTTAELPPLHTGLEALAARINCEHFRLLHPTNQEQGSTGNRQRSR